MRYLSKAATLLVIAGIICLGVAFFTGDSSFLSVGGVVSALIGIFCVYVVYKLLWSVLGIYLNFLVVGVACLCGVYFISGLKSSDHPAPVSMVETTEVAGADSDISLADLMEEEPSEVSEDTRLAEQVIAAAGNTAASDIGPVMPDSEDGAENRPAELMANASPKLLQSAEPAPSGASETGSWLDSIISFFNKQQGGEAQATREVYNNITPYDYPSIKGHPRVVRGSVLYLKGYHIRLYGIEAPYPDQTCADNHKRSYTCGLSSIKWLQNWINNREVTCYVLGKVVRGWATGICMVEGGKYDLAAVITGAGWAVAYTQNTDIYVAYEKDAARNRRGLWAGSFYKPWDWYKIQTRKVEVKVEGGKSKGFDFWGLF